VSPSLYVNIISSSSSPEPPLSPISCPCPPRPPGNGFGAWWQTNMVGHSLQANTEQLYSYMRRRVRMRDWRRADSGRCNAKQAIYKARNSILSICANNVLDGRRLPEELNARCACKTREVPEGVCLEVFHGYDMERDGSRSGPRLSQMVHASSIKTCCVALQNAQFAGCTFTRTR